MKTKFYELFTTRARTQCRKVNKHQNLLLKVHPAMLPAAELLLKKGENAL